MQSGNAPSSTAQITPAGASAPYEVSRLQLDTAIVSWTYYVLSPNSTITAVANQKLTTAIHVTTQVTEQLEEVVNQLRDVVGK